MLADNVSIEKEPRTYTQHCNIIVLLLCSMCSSISELIVGLIPAETYEKQDGIGRDAALCHAPRDFMSKVDDGWLSSSWSFITNAGKEAFLDFLSWQWPQNVPTGAHMAHKVKTNTRLLESPGLANRPARFSHFFSKWTCGQTWSCKFPRATLTHRATIFKLPYVDWERSNYNTRL